MGVKGFGTDSFGSEVDTFEAPDCTAAVFGTTPAQSRDFKESARTTFTVISCQPQMRKEVFLSKCEVCSLKCANSFYLKHSRKLPFTSRGRPSPDSIYRSQQCERPMRHLHSKPHNLTTAALFYLQSSPESSDLRGERRASIGSTFAFSRWIVDDGDDDNLRF